MTLREKIARAMQAAIEPSLEWDMDPSDVGMFVNDQSKSEYLLGADGALEALREHLASDEVVYRAWDAYAAQAYLDVDSPEAEGGMLAVFASIFNEETE